MSGAVLMSGGMGFVGKNVLKVVSSRYTVYSIVRRNVRMNNDNVIPLVLKNPELHSDRFYSKLISDNNIESVIHIAAITGEKRVSWKQYNITNVMWTKNLALGFLNADVDHNKFIFISTVGVYGTNPKKLPADEKTPYNPDGKYHTSKVLAEKKLIDLQEKSDLPLIILRPTIMYGYWDYGFLYKISQLIKRKLFPIFGNPLIHLLDVQKIAEICLHLLRRNILGIYNLCDDNPIYLNEIIDYLIKISGGKCFKTSNIFCKLINIMPSESLRIRFKLLCNSWYYDNSKIRSKLGISFGETIDNLGKYRHWYG